MADTREYPAVESSPFRVPAVSSLYPMTPAQRAATRRLLDEAGYVEWTGPPEGPWFYPACVLVGVLAALNVVLWVFVIAHRGGL